MKTYAIMCANFPWSASNLGLQQEVQGYGGHMEGINAAGADNLSLFYVSKSFFFFWKEFDFVQVGYLNMQ